MKCELCGRDNILNFHHLIPVFLHKKKWYKKNYSKDELNKGINICKYECHPQIHSFITEKEMGKDYNTLEKLLEHPKIKKYVEFISKKQN